MNQPTVYLDNNATTRVDEAAVEAMLPLFCEQFGNPASTHRAGAAVGALVDQARAQVADLLGARPGEIVFTSGGTEADNAALFGTLAARPTKRHVIISSVEHPAINEPADRLEREGYEITRLDVDSDGHIDLATFEAALRDDTALVSVMLVNNETGVVFPLADISRIAKARGVLVHTDAVNAIGKHVVNVDELGVDLLSLSAHKLHGPKGVGALYVRRGTPFVPVMLGGKQERSRRGGTTNSPGIVGLGVACEHAASRDAGRLDRIRQLRDRLESRIAERFTNARVIGAAADRVVNTSCICFAGMAAEPIVLLLSEAGICVSSGAACASGSLEPSPVLRAMRIDPEIAQGQIRFSLGKHNTAEEIDRTLDALSVVIKKAAASNLC